MKKAYGLISLLALMMLIVLAGCSSDSKEGSKDVVKRMENQLKKLKKKARISSLL